MSNYTVRYSPSVRRRWFLWHAYGRISATWTGPGEIERGHTSESRLGAYWRKESAIERAQSWRVFAERIARQAGLRVLSSASKPYVPEGETGQFIERGERG